MPPRSTRYYRKVRRKGQHNRTARLQEMNVILQEAEQPAGEGNAWESRLREPFCLSASSGDMQHLSPDKNTHTQLFHRTNKQTNSGVKDHRLPYTLPMPSKREEDSLSPHPHVREASQPPVEDHRGREAVQRGLGLHTWTWVPIQRSTLQITRGKITAYSYEHAPAYLRILKLHSSRP